jgi:isocitrate lyase
MHQHGDAGVRKHLHSFTTEKAVHDASAAMRRHDDQVAALKHCGVEDRLGGMPMAELHRHYGDAGLARVDLDISQNAGCLISGGT